eukprot:scaffold884_cov288-Chaetoceros_neogracile.AAC.2
MDSIIRIFLVFTPLETPKSFDETFDLCRDFRFIALWSRAAACGKCNHVLLDEDTQAGWDDDSSDGIDESLNEVKCPCCTTLVKPHIGFVEIPPHTPDVAISRMGTKVNSTNEHLPAQVQNKLPSDQSEANNETCPTLLVLYNNHCCAFAAWDKSIALAACHSAAKGVSTLQHIIRKKNRPKAVVDFQNFLIDAEEIAAMTKSLLKTDYPLLANFNLQEIGQGDWDNADLSTILVKLVEPCDKRYFYPAIEAVLQ